MPSCFKRPAARPSKLALNLGAMPKIVMAATTWPLQSKSGVDKAFYHDANKMSSNEGSIVKQLRVSSVRDSSTGGYFFNLSVNNKISNVQTKFDIFVSQAEMRLIQSIMNYAIPRILGFDEMFAGAPDVKESLPSSPETTGDRPPF